MPMSAKDPDPLVYGNTYCMERLPNGVRCHERIPMHERACPSCNKRKQPSKENA